MPDRMTPEQRHRCMSNIRSKNTKPEMVVKKFLFAQGFRYRANDRRLPGTPDIVLRKYRTVIFVNGCFWHGHNCDIFKMPQTNEEFWKKKIDRNKERDKRNHNLLLRMGWRIIKVWECQLKPSKREMTLRSIERTLHQIFIYNLRPASHHSTTTTISAKTIRKYSTPEDLQPTAIAAEESSEH